MGRLFYTASVSLDGFAADANGGLDWSVPAESVFDFHVQRMAAVSTEILGRTTYQLMQYWQTFDDPAGSAAEFEFADRWREIDKIAASSTMTLADLGDSKDRLVADLSLGEIAAIAKDAAGEVAIFGPTTAAPAIGAGLVEVFEFFTIPVILGAGLPALSAGTRLDLKLTDQHTFDNGVIYTRYEPR